MPKWLCTTILSPPYLLLISSALISGCCLHLQAAKCWSHLQSYCCNLTSMKLRSQLKLMVPLQLGGYPPLLWSQPLLSSRVYWWGHLNGGGCSPKNLTFGMQAYPFPLACQIAVHYQEDQEEEADAEKSSYCFHLHSWSYSPSRWFLFGWCSIGGASCPSVLRCPDSRNQGGLVGWCSLYKIGFAIGVRPKISLA